MSAYYSTAGKSYEYRPTIIESRLLVNRLATQIAFLTNEIKNDPRRFATIMVRDLLPTPKGILILVGATGVVLAVMLMPGRVETGIGPEADTNELPSEVTLIDLAGAGNVGGSGPIQRASHGGGGGGSHDAAPSQVGKLPPPVSSPIPAAIPIALPVHAQMLPVAGINIDPAMWHDVKAPVYGDPRSISTIPSKGPGDGEGIGISRGSGIGDGNGPGFGPGENGNAGGGFGQNGCCGFGIGAGCGYGRGDGTGCIAVRASEVDQRPRLLSKPEPQYTEEARRNQITGTVRLRAVFASSGEVAEIQALNTLPFGLTEKAIVAARQIKFVPAKKGGQPVSVYMQLEYNFNLY
jgi:TonB family protein